MATITATSVSIELSRVSTHASSHLPSGMVTPSERATDGGVHLEEASTADLLATEPQASGATRFEALDSYPDDAWGQVLCCLACHSVSAGGIYSWGVMQDALSHLGPSVSWIGSVQAACEAVLAIPIMRLIGAYGPRNVALVGTFVAASGPFLASFCTNSFPGLFVTEGLLFGIGQSLIFFPAAVHPSSYFQKRRNLATGLTYAGGGIGGAVFSLLSSVLIQHVGISWTLRILALVDLVITFPAAYLMRSRLPKKPLRGGGPAVDWSMFRDARFVCLFFGTAFALFPLFVPPFFLPLYASSLKLGPMSGSLLLAGFNLSSAFGRIGSGLGADRYLGSLNAMILCMAIFGLTICIIWPLATSLAPLAVFAIVNGAVAGGFFSLSPGVVGSLFGTAQLGVTFGMMVSSWTPGYALGAPIAGYILEAAGGAEAGYSAFRPAILYSGTMALASCLLMCGARFIESRDLRKRV